VARFPVFPRNDTIQTVSTENNIDTAGPSSLFCRETEGSLPLMFV